MESNAKTSLLLKKAKSNGVFAVVLGGIGGGLIGYPVGTALGGGDANWTLAAIGAGVLAIGIPIANGANKKAKQAVDIYNSSIDDSVGYQFVPEFTIISNQNGIGFSMSF